jgi:hypothetical protein
MMNRRPVHRGYTLLAVLAMISLIMSLCGLAYRELAATLRLEVARQTQSDSDAGRIHALARCLSVLETGVPSTNPYVRMVMIATASGPKTFKVTFASPNGILWSVQAEPIGDNEFLDPLPSTFAGQ